MRLTCASREQNSFSLIRSLIFIILVTAATAVSLRAQEYQDYTDGFDLDRYRETEVISEWSTKFDSEEAKSDFRKLRNFLQDRNDLLGRLNEMLLYYPDNADRMKELNGDISEIRKAVGKDSADSDKRVTINNRIFASYLEYNGYPQIAPIKQLPVSELIEMKAYYEQLRNRMISDEAVRGRLKRNINIVKNDIYTCNSQLDLTLAPELGQQRFRILTSICFAALIGILLIVFFTIIYMRSGNDLSKELLSGNGLQFITLFVLIIAIILFGILNILKGSELAAILSGISGYILGKGVGTHNATPVTPVTTPPANSPATPLQDVPPGNA